jgi:small-conductance mechanosensitive channel
VKNWSLRDNLRRIVIPVGVARGCDPRKVRAILLKVAHENPNVITTPAPTVELADFGEDSLAFKLYAFIDLNKGGGTSTDLRIAILDAFDEAGIKKYASDSHTGRTSTTGTPTPLLSAERDAQNVQPPTPLRRTNGSLSA